MQKLLEKKSPAISGGSFCKFLREGEWAESLPENRSMALSFVFFSLVKFLFLNYQECIQLCMSFLCSRQLLEQRECICIYIYICISFIYMYIHIYVCIIYTDIKLQCVICNAARCFEWRGNNLCSCTGVWTPAYSV